MKTNDQDVVILLLYVGDIILAGFNAAKAQKFVQDFAGVFDLKDIGQLTYFWGYRENGDIFVNQSKYVKNLIHKVRIESCKRASTPCKPHNKMLINEGKPLQDSTLYRSLVGYCSTSLLHTQI